MKYIYSILTVLLIAGQAFGAAFTSKATGNWSASGQTTWNEVGVPGNGDTVTIAATHVVTVDVDTTTGGGTVGSGSGVAELIIATGVTLTLSGNLQFGTGTDGQVGKLTFGAGSTLALGSNSLVLSNAIVRSAATSGSWATVSGTGAIAGVADPVPGQDILLTYVSFQNTGIIMFKCGSVRNTNLTPQIDIQHCAFTGCGRISFGYAAVTPASVKHVIDYCDFRELSDTSYAIEIAGANADATATKSFSHNTVSHTSARRNVRIYGIDGVVSAGCSFNNTTWGVGSGHTGGAWTIEDAFACGSAAASGANLFGITGSEDAVTIQDSFLYCDWANAHPFAVTSTGGSGTNTIRRNAFETPYIGDDSDLFVPKAATHQLLLANNVKVGPGSLIGSAGNYTAAEIACNHNTLFNDDASHLNYPPLFLIHDGVMTGTLTFQSNLISSVGTLDYGLQDINNDPAQAITADYNAFDDVTSAYDGLQVTGGTRDIGDLEPGFVDATRKLSTWSAGGAIVSPSAANAITYLLAINGYNSTTKTQSDTPSSQGPSDLVTWVMAGFAPTNSALKDAGHDGVTIGAVEGVFGDLLKAHHGMMMGE